MKLKKRDIEQQKLASKLLELSFNTMGYTLNEDKITLFDETESWLFLDGQMSIDEEFSKKENSLAAGIEKIKVFVSKAKEELKETTGKEFILKMKESKDTPLSLRNFIEKHNITTMFFLKKENSSDDPYTEHCVHAIFATDNKSQQFFIETHDVSDEWETQNEIGEDLEDILSSEDFQEVVEFISEKLLTLRIHSPEYLELILIRD